MTARASILVPTHDGTVLLERAVATALRQSVTELEVLIVGDGVTDACRATVEALCAQDTRVRFLDLPKSSGHGEANRDLGVRATLSDAVVYLADDDLLAPDHVATLLPMLERAHLVHSTLMVVNAEGDLVVWPTDLGVPENVAWLLSDPRRNCVGLTGTAHRRSTYLELDAGWQTAPVGEWPDHALWKRFLQRDDVVGATSPAVTTIVFPAPYRRHLTAAEFDERHRRMYELVTSAQAVESLASLADEARGLNLIRLHRLAVDTGLALENAMRVIAELEARLAPRPFWRWGRRR